MIHAIRKEGETSEKVANRFKKQWHWFRLVPMVRAKRYHTKKRSKRLVRISALKCAEYRAKRRKEQLYA